MSAAGDARRQRSPRHPPIVRRLGLASFFQDVASDMVYPLLPGFLAGLGGGPAVLGAMESAADAAVAFVKGWAGRASDRAARRKPFVVAGYAGSALARPLLALVATAGQVVALRIWDRVAKGVRSAPRDALLAASVEPGRRAAAFGYQRGLDHLGAAVGPLVAAAALAAGASVRWVFALATLPALAGVATVAFGLPREPRAAREVAAAAPPPSLEPSSAGARLPRRAVSAAFLFGLANASDAFLLSRAAELGAPVPALPLGWSALHALRWLAAERGGHLADRLGAGRALVLGWAIYGAIYLLFGAAGSLPLLLAALVPYAALAGLLEGGERAFVVELGGAEGAGTRLGLWQRASGFGALGSSLVFGLLWQSHSARLAFVVAALAALAAGAVLGTTAHRTSTARS